MCEEDGSNPVNLSPAPSFKDVEYTVSPGKKLTIRRELGLGAG